ncbi:MAG TPA: hypothetical protein VF389_00860, partial [Woeseiaceae bacterium]
MAITIERDRSVNHQPGDDFSLECPYCGVYAQMTPQSVPDVAMVLQHRPKHVGVVYQCNACHAPIFL